MSERESGAERVNGLMEAAAVLFKAAKDTNGIVSLSFNSEDETPLCAAVAVHGATAAELLAWVERQGEEYDPQADPWPAKVIRQLVEAGITFKDDRAEKLIEIIHGAIQEARAQGRADTLAGKR